MALSPRFRARPPLRSWHRRSFQDGMEPKVDLKAERDTGQPIDINQWLLYCSGLLVVTTKKTTTDDDARSA